MSKRNLANREKVKMPHTMGTRTYARTREMEREMLGAEPDEIHMFKVAHTHRKQGGTLDAPVQTALEQMEAYLSQMPEGTNHFTAKNIAFTKVMGEDSLGRAKNHGLGVTPLHRRCDDLADEVLAETERRLEEEKARRVIVDETLTEMQEEVRQVRQEQEQMKKEHEEELRLTRKKCEDELALARQN